MWAAPRVYSQGRHIIHIDDVGAIARPPEVICTQNHFPLFQLQHSYKSSVAMETGLYLLLLYVLYSFTIAFKCVI